MKPSSTLAKTGATAGAIAAALGLVGAAGGAAYASLIAPNRIEVNNIRFWHPRLPRAFHDYKIAYFSDVHLDGSQRALRRLEQTVDLINAEQPDLIVSTGDFVSLLRGTQVDDLSRQFRRLKAPDGVLTTFGNHEYRYHRLAAQRAVEAAGVCDLNNRVVTLRRGDDSLHIAGVDSVSRQRARLDQVMRELPEDGMAILLAHEPDFADFAAPTGRFSLQLSGHTHGGQVNLPLLVDYALPAHGRHYVSGFYNVRGMWLYVNRGIGSTGLPIRFRSRPEITVMRFGILNL